MTYNGRFAPSPTGPLHMGSLVAAVGSYMDAKANSGKWFLRMEDLDPPREMQGAKALIPKQLEHHGLYWDDEISFQSDRLDIYRDHLEQLNRLNATYQCNCSRQRVKSLSGIYDGLCRQTQIDNSTNSATRVKIDNSIEWPDLIQGNQEFSPVQLSGDFIVKRRDDLFSYQLAVAVDDSLQNIDRVIRGADLLDSTARQIHIHKILELPSPSYGHLPLVTNELGVKLSKQFHAPTLDENKKEANLLIALRLLGQSPTEELNQASADEILQWGIAHWEISAVPQTLPPGY